MTTSQDVQIAKQIERFELIQNSFANLRALEKESITKAQIQTRINLLDSNWDKFQSGHEKLTTARIAEKELPYFKENVYAQCEEAFALARAAMLTLLEDLSLGQKEQKSSVGYNQSVSHTSALPKITLPTFVGDYHMWRSFCDLFKSMIIDNSELSPVEKFHYLRTSLSGEAAQLIANLPLTSENFSSAWEILCTRYENKRVLVDTHIDIIFKVNPIQRKSAADIKHLLASVKESLGCLKILGAPVEHWDYIIVYLIVRKLDAATHEAWEIYRGASKEPSSFKDLESFLNGRVQALESVENRNPKNSLSSGQSQNKQNSKPSGFKTHVSSVQSGSTPVGNRSVTPQQTCVSCGNGHSLYRCPSYLSKTVDQRKAFIKEKQLCFNCLGPHRATLCRSVHRCRDCGRNHHTSLHFHSTTSMSPRTDVAHVSLQQPTTESQFNTHSNLLPSSVVSNHAAPRADAYRQILLATALVRLQCENGAPLIARALLDQGSEISFISENIVQQMHLKRRHANFPLIGIGAHPSGTTKGVVNVKIKPHFDSEFECDVTMYILSKLTTQLPSTSMATKDWAHLKGLTLADPNFIKPGHIDLILGADVYGHLLESGLSKSDPSSPIAQKTSLGWVVSGSVNSERAENIGTVRGFQCSIDHDLDNLLQRFWHQEEPLPDSSPLTPEEKECEAHFVSTHFRNSTGRYVVRLPFKQSPDKLGESKSLALSMFSKLQRRLASNSSLHHLYSEFLQEYERLGHMVREPMQDVTTHQYYLPHHGVLRESSSTTKLRVVFNGSFKTSSGVSLNDILHVGPKLQLDISDVITSWRQHRYVFSTDIEKMFRQIGVHPDDWAYQKILWGSQSAHRVYMLTTVTYGLAPAPYLANRVLQQLILDEGKNYPLAINVIRYGTYVDDMFGGADTLDEAQQIVQQLDNLSKAGGFYLQKWISNHPRILCGISSERHALKPTLQLGEKAQVRTLGITWNPTKDYFSFSSPFLDTFSTACTKRYVLSCIARLFDPHGWIAPITIRAKILMQKIWLCKVNWDDPIPVEISQDWLLFMSDLKELSHLHIPRWLGTSTNQLGIEIHGFADASKDAMACVIYLRVINDFNDILISFVEAKTKVAPLKRMTIPRLELTAAMILTKRAAHVQQLLNLQHAPIHLWTDSSVALTWINGHPSRWRDFVSNRVTKIQDTLPSAHWHHVSGKENPADCASRGITIQQLAHNNVWWKGPHWLSSHSTNWPTAALSLEQDANLEERCTPKTVMAFSQSGAGEIWDLIYKYSKLSKLLRITVICRRWVSRKSLIQYPLKPQELEAEKAFWIKATQQAYFSSEIKQLAQNKALLNTNPLCRLVPFLDNLKMLRVGGRLRNALLDAEAKHPLLLPRDSALTTLLIREAHEKTLHGGAQVMLAFLRQTFWILGGRAPIKAYIHQCVRCTRLRGETAKQLMGQLPANRITPSRPFLHSGVDYAGPLTLKTWKGRGAKTYKGYIVLFVCMATSAIHLEVTTDYTLEGFIAAYKRFTSRRGICASLTSDCGTNLIGADAELKKLFRQSSKFIGDLSALLANDGTEWRFNPPSAPHFGGKWEAGVKSVKFHLRRIIGDTALTFEELTTLLAQIEAVLNSRPICPLSDDPADVNALTPGHFLIGSSLNTIPEPSLTNVPVSRLSRWQLLKQMLDSFWNRWSKEYLQRFQSISKWKQKTDSIQPGTLVLISDERYPPTKWPLGRILTVHPGADGLTRVATVKTQTSIMKRPVVKLCPLPI